jgi:hypothetical protein
MVERKPGRGLPPLVPVQEKMSGKDHLGRREVDGTHLGDLGGAEFHGHACPFND